MGVQGEQVRHRGAALLPPGPFVLTYPHSHTVCIHPLTLPTGRPHTSDHQRWNPHRGGRPARYRLAMTIERSRFAAGPVVSAMAALAVVLAVTASAYGYHRDELYFRVLDPAWGYTDQPPLLPLLARGAIAVFGDSVVALRVVSGVFAVASIAILAHITREVGGNRLAQGLTAWGMAGASMTLAFGHVLLTASIDAHGSTSRSWRSRCPPRVRGSGWGSCCPTGATRPGSGGPAQGSARHGPGH